MKKILIVMLLIVTFPLNTNSVPSKAQSFVLVANSTYTVATEAITPQAIDIPQPTDTSTPASIEGTPQPAEPGASQNEENTTFQAIEADIKPAIETITLSFAGDCTIGDDERYTWNTFDEIYNKVKDPSYFFQGVKSIFENDDFSLVNLEGTFTKATKKAVKEYRFKGDPAYVDILLKGGIEGVTLANNHTLDYFQKGFDDTVRTLTQAKMAYTYFDTYFIREIKGFKIGFLGYKGWSHEKRSNDLLEKHIKEMREQGVDFIIANYHWGDQKSYYPNALQKRMAHFAIDKGVDLVIGHHPHVLQGMEVYKDRNILYSLGNFCYGGSPNPGDKDTVIYQHIITFDTQQKTILKTEFKIISARISSDPAKNNYQPVIATGEEEKRITQKFNRISEGLIKK